MLWVLIGWVIAADVAVWFFRKRWSFFTASVLELSVLAAVVLYGYFVKEKWSSKDRTIYRGFAVLLIFGLFLLYASTRS